MRAPIGLAILGVTALAALTGCTPPATVSESGYVLLVAKGPSETHLLAELNGELAISGDCFSLQGSGSNLPVIFPVGTRVASGDQLGIPGVGTVEIGDNLQGTGGEIPVDIAPVEVPAGCSTDTVIIFEAD